MERAIHHPRLARQRAKFLEEVIIPTNASKLIQEAFRLVDRRDFIPIGSRRLANSDSIIPLGRASSMSEPSLVALMVNLLEPTGSGRVLEIGTASGYGAAILSCCFDEVHSIEIDSKLAKTARKRLGELGYNNVFVHEGDGLNGLPDQAPFDGIIITAGAKEIPKTLARQLKEEGKLVLPVGNDTARQTLMQVIRKGNQINAHKSLHDGQPIEVHFHLLYSQIQGGWTEDTVLRVLGFKTAILQAFAQTVRMPPATLITILTACFQTDNNGLVDRMRLPDGFRAEDFAFADEIEGLT